MEKSEAETFIDCAGTLPPTASQVTPIKLSKVSQKLSDGDTSIWSVVESSVHNDLLNPDRHVPKEYFLLHQNDHKNCPLSVKRCQTCRRVFSDSDWVLVKTEGICEYTTTGGKRKSAIGDICIHYLRACLIEHQQNFNFSMLRVLKSTLTYLQIMQKRNLLSKYVKLKTDSTCGVSFQFYILA